MFKRPQRVVKTSEKTCRVTKKTEETSKIMKVLYNLHDLHEKAKYEEFYECSYVEEFHANANSCKMQIIQ